MKERSPFDSRAIVESYELRRLLAELRLATEGGTVRRKQKDKLEQVGQFVNILVDSLGRAKLLHSPCLTVWDTGCGRAYLSFLVHYYLRNQMKMKVHTVGIDADHQLIRRCVAIRDSMRYEGMQFIAGSNRSMLERNDGHMDVLCSLHACDTATDEAIALGIARGAKLIVVSPCCQREIKGQMKGDSGHVLKGITKYPYLKERLADVVTDAIRCLALESAGYRVRVLGFVNSEITPKNLMILAVKVANKASVQPLRDYHRIAGFFHLSPLLESMMPALQSRDL